MTTTNSNPLLPLLASLDTIGPYEEIHDAHTLIDSSYPLDELIMEILDDLPNRVSARELFDVLAAEFCGSCAILPQPDHNLITIEAADGQREALTADDSGWVFA